MGRIKFHLEYVLNMTSKEVLWDAISTPSGLALWFADKVEFNGKLVTFKWGKNEEREARIVGIRNFLYIRFKWLDNPYPRESFELSIQVNELTNNNILVIKDYSEEDELEESESVWDYQVEALRRIKGF